MKCVILAGGSGDRLWPLSRKNYPKQFMEVRENRSLLQETIVRNMPYCDEFIIVTNVQYEFIVEGQMQAFQGLKYRCIYEEVAQNTAAAISLIAVLSNPSELLFVVASDTMSEGPGYKDCVVSAIHSAKQGYITLFGIEPKQADSRYGYIQCKELCKNPEGTWTVTRFHEKPKKEEAEGYLKEGGYVWNSGMFLMCAGDFVQELRIYQSSIYEACRRIKKQLRMTETNLFIPKRFVEELPSVSVEKAVFEQSGQLRVVKGGFDWLDIDELEDVVPYFGQKDGQNLILEECQNVDVVNRTRKQLVVANQVQDMTIVNTEDTLYIVPKDARRQNMKEIMAKQYGQYKEYFDRNRVAYRQWGNYEVLSQGNGFKVKRVTVYPGKTIYSHIHKYRSEHWSIVNGEAQITLQDKTGDYTTNESIYVPMGVSHEVFNPTGQNLIIIEVGIGEQITESDMIRTEEQKENKEAYPAEPISRLEPAYKDYLWGGVRLREIYGKKCDYDVVAESWELSAHPAGQSVIAEGRYKGMRFGTYIRHVDRGVLGWKCQAYEEFPILIKLIDARQKLSVQVHPDDAFALEHEGEYGKNEMWYILDCEENAGLYCGFRREVTKEEVKKAALDGTLLDLLREIKVKKGDTVFIPSQTVHAIGAGILLCEIQQNSNSTYRIYDYGRKDKYGNSRELHLEKALQVADLSGKNPVSVSREKEERCEGYTKQLLGRCKYFESLRVDVETEARIPLEETSFMALIVIEGEGKMQTEEKELMFDMGDTFFVPAGEGQLIIHGKCQVIITKV